jgi:3alpha(or 20beta)-hydroxysteroid dehydrogenase
VVAACQEAEGVALANALGNQALYVALDVADEASWTAAIDRIESQVGPVSVLINNAAYLAVLRPCLSATGAGSSTPI